MENKETNQIFAKGWCFAKIFFMFVIGCVIGTHAGPGAFAVSFFDPDLTVEPGSNTGPAVLATTGLSVSKIDTLQGEPISARSRGAEIPSPWYPPGDKIWR